MPARRTFDDPAAELAYYRAKEEREREQSRLGMRRLRAERRLANTVSPTDGTVRVTAPREGDVRPTVKQTVSQPPPAPPASLSPDPTLSTPPKAPPKERGNQQRIAELIDALRAQGMTGTLTAKDRRAFLDTEADEEEVAALYAAVFNGEYGDQFMHDNLTVALCVERQPGWLSHRAGHRAPQRDPWARSNGHPKAASGAAAVRAVFRKAKDDAAAAVAGGRGGDGVGAGEAGAGVPRLLRD